MAPDLERIIQSIRHGNQDRVQAQLQDFNTEYAQCYFFNTEEREKRRQQELEEFRCNKVRERVPESDSDFSCSDLENDDLVLRRRLAAALVWFIRMRLQPSVLGVCLRTLRILSRDQQALAPLVTDTALLTLASLGGINVAATLAGEGEKEFNECYNQVKVSPVDGDGGTDSSQQVETSTQTTDSSQQLSEDSRQIHRNITEIEEIGDNHVEIAMDTSHSPFGVRGRSKEIEEEGEDEDGEVCRREAIKALCNVIYNSQRAQERASTLSLLKGLTDKLKKGMKSPSPPSGQFYELRLLFLLTALRPELRRQLQQERGVSMLIAALEQCLSVQWGEACEVLRNPRACPVSTEMSLHATEILKALFNVTHGARRREPDEEESALYRHLVAVLGYCLLLQCDGEEHTEELHGHAVNVLSSLPLACLDVLLSTRLTEGSRKWEGVNMDCVHVLLLFMERRLDRGKKLMEKLTPVLNLLTESCKVHRETRHYLRQQILPPLRDVTSRPEQEGTLRGRLIRLMTHVDTDIKHCAAELLFVLCKENVRRFVKYTGYGNAAGLLAARGLLAGGQAASSGNYSSDSDSDTEEYRQARGRINLVTGRVEEEQSDPMEGMTEEEKEIEARRLLSMFSRLSRDNIIQPMGVMLEGKLSGHLRHYTQQEDDESEEDTEGDLEDE